MFVSSFTSQARIIHQTIRKISGFCKTVEHAQIIEAKNGNCIAKVVLQKDDLNLMEGMHGGFAATLIEHISSFGMLSNKQWMEPSSTVSLNISYMRFAQLGDEITVESKVMKVGKNLAFLDVEIRNATNELLVKGEHVKLKNTQ